MCHPTPDADWPLPAGLEERRVTSGAPGRELPCLEVAPAGHGRDVPAVVVVSDIFGPARFYVQLARRLAADGYLVVLPDYFHALGPLPGRGVEAARARRRELDEPAAVTELAGLVDSLRADAPRRPVAAVGFCVGGTFVLHLAGDVDDLPVVCFYGFPAASPRGGPRAVRPPLERPARLRSPVLGFWGSEDEGVGIHDVERFVARARAAGSDVESHVYPGAGHGFLRRLDADEDSADRRASADAWERTRAFLRRRLGDPRAR